MKDTLDEIRLRFSTDKSSRIHDFLRHYHTLFHCLRDEPVRLLEFGVFAGASLKTWGEYFPNGTIIGADINPDVRQYEGGEPHRRDRGPVGCLRAGQAGHKVRSVRHRRGRCLASVEPPDRCLAVPVSPREARGVLRHRGQPHELRQTGRPVQGGTATPRLPPT